MTSPTPEEVHRSALVLDCHADTPQRFVDENWSFTDGVGTGQLSLDTARAGGLAGEIFALWVDPDQWPGRFAHRAFSLLDGLLEQIRLHPNDLQLCLTPDDILTAKAANRFAAVIAIEGGHAIENDLGLLRLFHRLGVRCMTLTWSNSNEWADSSGDIDDPAIPHHGGLTPFGREVIAEMNRLGIIIDVSHVSDATFWDVLRTTRAPIIASHSSSRVLTQAPRNLTDEMLRALATANGVAMVNFFPAFIDENWRQAWNAQREERVAAHAILEKQYEGTPVPFHASNKLDRDFAARIGRAPFDSLIDHFMHMIDVAGIDHVGIGTDFDGIPQPPDGIDTAADLPKFTAALMARGCSAEDMHKLLGGNLMRVFRDIQFAAS
ncbi:dipeptidase [Granulicella sibirica]|uniref:Putative dipeptidase n=1 Tax=Granulicella sibirica TaxID=2479048 RepID=A0A4Q0T326_9BACT|nr:dipeptidase [Granulicella sibirica]RXH56359.1 putative dipeptidase [Granulicella sibirica]